MTRDTRSFQRVSQWLRKLIGTPDPCDPADLAGSDLSSSAAPTMLHRHRPGVGRRTTDESGDDVESGREPPRSA